MKKEESPQQIDTHFMEITHFYDGQPVISVSGIIYHAGSGMRLKTVNQRKLRPVKCGRSYQFGQVLLTDVVGSYLLQINKMPENIPFERVRVHQGMISKRFW